MEKADPQVVSLCRPVLDKDDAAIKEGIHDDNKIEGAKIEGKYSDVIDKLKQKFIDKGIPLTGEMMVMDCFDGAEHVKTKRKILVSYHSAQ